MQGSDDLNFTHIENYLIG